MLRFLRANVDPPAGRLWLGDRGRSAAAGTHGQRIEIGLGRIIARLRRRSLRMLCHCGRTGGSGSFAALVTQTETAVVVLGNTNRYVDRLAIRILEALNADRSR